MPTYEYQCTKCSTRFDLKQRFNDEPVAFCPSCAASARRIIQSVPIVFKGSGFYCTDNGRSTCNHHSRKDPDSDSKTTEKPEIKTECPKPAKAECASESGG
ncbi:MAG: hypothetical protein IBX68_08780 [Dehalococcoidia bacterium]|nr:hypothetical protein [Dehalococcoidia bacterium]